MYYILIFLVTCVFAGNVWIIKLATAQGWNAPFLSLSSYTLALILATSYVIFRKKFTFQKSAWFAGFKPAASLIIANMSLIAAARYTSAEKIGLILGANVVFVPIFQYILYRWKVPKLIYLSLALALTGNFIINSGSGSAIGFNIGDMFAMITSLGYALAIVWITSSSKDVSSEMFLFIQCLLGVGGYFLICIFGQNFQDIKSLPLFPLLYLGGLSYSVALIGQFIAQLHISSTVTAIILAMSAIISVFIGVIFFGLNLTISIIIATIFYLLASIIGIYSKSNNLQ